MIYLDYAASTPVDEEVLANYCSVESKFFANITSLNMLGQKENYMYESLSADSLNSLGFKNHDIIYTSGATEANNIGLFGIANKYSSGTIITTKIEHPSVYEVMKSLESRFNVIYLDINSDGIIDINEFEKAMTKDTILVSIMWVNNIIGSIQPIGDVIRIMKKYPKAKLLVDATQGIGKIRPNFNIDDVDMFTFSTHKIYGPKGIGCLIKKKGLELSKLLQGSHSQYNLRPGTFDLALISATNLAIKKVIANLDNHYNYLKELYMYLYNGIKDIKEVVINSPLKYTSYSCMSISILNKGKFVKSETILHYLEQSEIYVSIGTSCSSKLAKPEKTILALTGDIDRSYSNVRISISHLTTYEEIDKLIEVLKKYGELYVWYDINSLWGNDFKKEKL